MTQETETRTESVGGAEIERQEYSRAEVSLTVSTVSTSTNAIEPYGRPLLWLDEDADEREAAEGMRRLSLKALESQWDDDEPDQVEI